MTNERHSDTSTQKLMQRVALMRIGPLPNLGRVLACKEPKN